MTLEYGTDKVSTAAEETLSGSSQALCSTCSPPISEDHLEKAETNYKVEISSGRTVASDSVDQAGEEGIFAQPLEQSEPIEQQLSVKQLAALIDQKWSENIETDITKHSRGSPLVFESNISSSEPIVPSTISAEAEDEPKISLKLACLIVQFHSEYICVSCNVEGNVQYPFEKYRIPAKLGRTEQGTWIIGPDLENSRGTLRELWWLKNCLAKPDGGRWSQNIKVNQMQEEVEITFEFLFVVFLKLVKINVQEQLSGVISQLIISVPVYLPSVHRKQLLASGSIAGFDNTQLVYESAAIAHSVLASSPDEKMYNVTSLVTICENSFNVYISIRTVDMFQRYVSPILADWIDFAGKYRNGTVEEYAGSASRWEKMWQTILEELKMENINVWGALEFESCVLLVCWRTERFKDDMISLAKKIASDSLHLFFPPDKFHDIVSKEIVRFYTQDQISILKKGNCLVPRAHPGQGTEGEIFTSGNLLLKVPEVFDGRSVTFHTKKLDISSNIRHVFRFTQVGPTSKVLLGDLTVNTITEGFRYVLPIFLRQNDIWELIRVDLEKPGTDETEKSNRTLSSGEYEWMSIYTSESNIAKFTSIINQF